MILILASNNHFALALAEQFQRNV